MTQPTKMAQQRQKLIARLRIGPLTTEQARLELGIDHVAARVFELRHDMNLPIANIRMGRQSAYVLVDAA